MREFTQKLTSEDFIIRQQGIDHSGSNTIKPKRRNFKDVFNRTCDAVKNYLAKMKVEELPKTPDRDFVRSKVRIQVFNDEWRNKVRNTNIMVVMLFLGSMPVQATDL